MLSASLLGGCGGSAGFTPTNPAPHRPVVHPPESIVIYSSGAPQRPHVDVGLLFVSHGPFSILREEASRNGCDAVVLMNFFRNGLAVSYTATCIVYVDSDA